MSHSHKVSLFDEVVVLTPLPPLLLLFLLLMKTRADIVVVVSAGAGAIMMEMLYIAEEISGRLISRYMITFNSRLHLRKQSCNEVL